MSRADLPAIREYSARDIDLIAERVAKSGMFNMNQAQAFTLCALCHAKGLHPIEAVQRYHIIQGRPSMRADAMLAEFQANGGICTWAKTTEQECEAVFAHPKLCPKGLTVRYTLADAKKAGLAEKDIWKKNPADMLVARVISRGIRRVMPGVVAGIYTPEEAGDMEPHAPILEASFREAPDAGPDVRDADPDRDNTPAARPIDWADYSDRLIGSFNANWLSECDLEGVPVPQDWQAPMVRPRLENGIATMAIDDAKVDPGKIAKASKPDVRDPMKARHALEWLYRKDPEWVELACEAYAKRKLQEARKAIGSPLAEAEDDEQPEAVTAKAGEDDGEWTEGRE